MLFKTIMQIQITAPQQLRGEIILPSSKSISNRALLIHALSHGQSMPQNISDCDDTFVMVRALNSSADLIDIMAAGTAMRFLSAYLAVNEGTRIITGTERMKQRPIGILVDALRTLGAKVEYVEKEGFPPLRITGGAHEGETLTLPGNVSSQYISALLMIGPTLKKGLTIELTGDIVSRPYIDLTLQLMHTFGAQAAWRSEREITVKPGQYQDIPYYVESDWSAASYWYEMMALTSDREAEIILPGLFSKSYQGDSAVRQIFERLGVQTSFFRNTEGLEGVRLTKQPRSCERLEYDFVNQPDLAQTFVVTCAMLNMPFHFTGLQSLKIKETDRISALINELHKLGYLIGEANNAELFWDGVRTAPTAGAAIDTYEDHRMAMAFAPCCLVSPDIRINNPQVVSKSYPHYWDNLKQIGFEINTL